MKTMIYNDLLIFKQNLIRNTRLLGIDFGMKHVGVAISDKDLNLATAKTIINRKNHKQTILELIKIIDENNIKSLIIGLPLNQNNRKTEFCKTIENFTNLLLKEISINIYFTDESLTSSNIEYQMKNDLNQNNKIIKKSLDKLAAQSILQSILDELKNIK